MGYGTTCKNGLFSGSSRRPCGGRRKPFSAELERAPTSGGIRSRRFPATGVTRLIRIGRESSSANSQQKYIPKSVKPWALFHGLYAVKTSKATRIYFPIARCRKATICPRVQVAVGEKLSPPIPLVILFSTAQATACA